MTFLIKTLSENFKNLEDLIDQLLDVCVFAIKNEYKDVDKIDWLSIGYEQGFSIAIDDQFRSGLLQMIDDSSKYYEIILKMEIGTDAPFFTALLTVLAPRLQKKIELDLSEKLNNDFKVFVWTDDEWYFDPEIEAPDYEDYFDSLEDDGVEKKVMIDWIESFCSTEKLRNYLVDVMDNKYKGQKLKELSEQWQ